MKKVNIIAISGRMGSGKDTFADMLIQMNPEYERKAFAGKLKQIASILTGVPIQKFEDQEFKKETMPKEWWYRDIYDEYTGTWSRQNVSHPIHAFVDDNHNEHTINKPTYRKLLQEIGTDALRDKIHTDIWINALFSDYVGVHTDHVLGGFEYPNWIITDCRFPNECERVKDMGGVVVRIERDGILKSDHVSETMLDSYKFDYVIQNNGTLEELQAKAKELMSKVS